MTNIKPQSKWTALKALLLAVPFLALLIASVPSAQARDHRYRHGYYRHRGYYRHHGSYHRRYYYRHGRRYYYGGDRSYYGPTPGVNVHVGL